MIARILLTNICLIDDSALSTLTELQKGNAALEAFMNDCFSLPECNGLSLIAYLIMPVQRIPRYKVRIFVSIKLFILKVLMLF